MSSLCSCESRPRAHPRRNLPENRENPSRRESADNTKKERKNKMKTMKKIFALALAMVMLMALALPVMAADPTYQIKILGSTSASAESAKDHTYEAYQILKGTVDPTAAETPGAVVNLGDVHWGDNINYTALLTKLKGDAFFGPGSDNMFSSVTTAQQFADVISATTFTTKYVEKLAHIMNQHLVGDPKATTDTAVKEPPYILTVPAGYYLIKDKKDSLTDMEDKDYTDIILEVSKNVTINHKGSVPTVSKEVSELNHTYKEYIDSATATTFYYKLTGTLPSDFDKYEEYAYKFVDTMGKGIKYLGIEKIYAIYNNGTDLDLTTGAEITHEESSNKLTVSFPNLKHDNNKHNFQPGNRIVVVYKAKLNKDAVIAKDGNPNEVYLEYSNDPQSEGTGTTSSDKTKVYTFGIQINKYDGASTTKKLKDVEFHLFRKVLGTGGVLENEYAIITNDIITDWTKDVNLATKQKTNDEGIITIHGLDTGVKYYLEETAAAPSYNPIAEPIEFQLTPTVDGSGEITGLDVTPSSYYNATPNSYKNGTDVLGVILNIPNSQGAVLPTTGGMGTTLFYVLGSILVLGAVVLLVTKKRMTY